GTEGCQNHPTATAASHAGMSHGMIEARVQILEQQPRPPVAHPHLASGLRQRARPRNAFEKFYLADSDGAPAAEIDPESDQGGIGHVLSPIRTYAAATE